MRATGGDAHFMTTTGDRLLEVQRHVLATMRRMFVTGMACFKAMDYQLEQFMRLLSKKSTESQEQSMRLLEEWIRNFRKGQAAYQEFVEDSFQRAQEILEKVSKKG